MTSFLSNFSLLAHCIATTLLKTGLGPGIAILGLYNFQRRFVPKILSGEKTHTIRGRRANPDKPGNLMHLYTGLRQKGAELLMRVPCLRVEEIEISPLMYVSIDGHGLSADEEEELARRDGFANFAEMMQFWAGRLPFRGHIIHWQFPTQVSGRAVSPFGIDRSVKDRATSPSRKVRRVA